MKLNIDDIETKRNKFLNELFSSADTYKKLDQLIELVVKKFGKDSEEVTKITEIVRDLKQVFTEADESLGAMSQIDFNKRVEKLVDQLIEDNLIPEEFYSN